MKELKNSDVRHRVGGRAVLTKRLIRLLISVNRFAGHRATERADLAWAARVADALLLAVQAGQGDPRLASVLTTGRDEPAPFEEIF